MKYRYGSGGYGYGYGRKKKKAGVVVLALLLVLALVGGGGAVALQKGWIDLPFLSDNTSSGSSGTEDPISSDTSSLPPKGVLPEDLTYVPRPQETPALTVGDMSVVTAGSYAVIDRLSGAVVMEKNSEERIFPGAATHIITAGMALERGNCSDVLTFSQFAYNLLGASSTRLGLVPGETILLEDALAAMLLSSCADAANAAAEAHNYGTFIEDLGGRARTIGCTGSRFMNPTGVSGAGHYSTALDLTRMEAYAQRISDYRRIAGAEAVALSANNLHPVNGWKVVQDNDLVSGVRTLFANSDVIASVESTTTGVDAASGYTVVCSFTTTGGARLTAAITGIPYEKGKGGEQCLPQMAALMQEAAKAADAASGAEVLTAGEALSSALTGGATNAVPDGAMLVAGESLRLVQDDNTLTNGTRPLFSMEYTVKAVYYEGLKETLKNYDGAIKEVGYLTVTDSNGVEVIDAIPVLLK